MPEQLKIIIIEETEEDFLLILRHLGQTSFQIHYERVADEKGLSTTLKNDRWDLVICDYILTEFNAFKALKIIKEHHLHMPFIIISERIGEENAILAIKSGADDYVLKDNLSRLAVVVERVIHEYQRREQLSGPNAGHLFSDKELQQIIDYVDEAIFIEQNGNLGFFNQKAKDVFAVTTFPSENFSIKNFIPTEIGTDLKLSEPSDYQIIKIQTGDGEEKWLEFRKQDIEWQGAAANLYFARDITAQKNMENRLQAAQRLEAIGTLAGGIAHDFNNILSPILGYTELVLEDINPESLSFKNLTQVYKAANRAKELVQQILTFSRQSGTEAKPIKIQVIVKESLKFLRASIPSTIEFNLQIDDDCRPVMADPTQIHQLIMNLCSNAYQAMVNQPGVLGVRLTEREILPSDPRENAGLTPGTYVLLSVSDTGHGMDSTLIQRIFEPFFTTREKSLGTGMGLSVVHGIVTDHRGYIDVQSEPGKGSRFEVYLPLIKQEKVSLMEIPSPEIYAGNEHIFLVDDEKDIVFLIKQMLESYGYKVTTRTSSLEAVQAFENQPEKYDLVITDQSMPNMTGEELARRLIRIRPQLPILLCTGFSDFHDKEQLKTNGIVDVILKPVLKNDLAKAVRQALDKKN
jgi:signal transduction histidine kinase